LRLELTDPDLVDVLIGRLRELEYTVARVGSRAIEIAVEERRDERNPPDQQQVELAFLVRACLSDHPGADFRVLD